MTELEEFLDEAGVSESEFLARVDDGDFQPLIWSSSAYDGSPTGASGFADEDGNYMPEDIITEARWPETGEESGLISDSERTEDRIRHEEERIESARKEASRIRAANTKYRRRMLEERYESVVGTKPVKMSMKAMRDEINKIHSANSLKELASVMRGFGF